MRATVSERNFRLVYQPIVNLATGETHHYEALTRFVGDESPADTIAFAEAVRLIADFDLAVCEMAIAAVLENPFGRLPIAVNLSGRSLEGSIFANALFEMLKVDRNLPKRIIFEVTESAVITRADFPDITPERAHIGAAPHNLRDLSLNCMAKSKVLYEGHPVAAVAATSQLIAEQALDLIEVEYGVLPHVKVPLGKGKPRAR